MTERTENSCPLTKEKRETGVGLVRELTILLENDKKRPLYEQIYEDIRAKVRAGDIPSGERLPSARALAGHLQVSRSTVDLAYARLQDEGYIEPVPCKGFFVCDVETLYELPVDEMATVEEDEPQGEVWRYDFSVNGIDEQGFPFAVWNRLTKTALLDTEQHMFVQGQSRGEAGLREALREYLHYARGVECSASQIVIGAGNDYLLFLLSVVLGREHVIAMENPTYLSACNCFKVLGYPVTVVGMDAAGMDRGDLAASGADIAYVMPSHQFPTGTVMTMERRTALLRWAREKKGRYIIEDDYDSEFRYSGHPLPALQGYDGGQHVIYLGTFSKSIAPSIRISYMVLPKPLLETYHRQAECFATTVSRIDQKVLEQFIRQGYFERHLNRMRNCYKQKHDRLVAVLQQYTQRFKIHGENAGLHILLEPVDDADVVQMQKKAQEAGIRISLLSEYCMEEGLPEMQKNGLLLGYATIPLEQIETAAEQLLQLV